MSIQVLHCSDLHLDKNFNISNIIRAQERKEDLNHNFSSIVDFALRNRPDLFLMAGDIFDKISPSNSSRIFLVQKIRQLKEAGIPVFMIGGNHDVPKFGSQQLAIDILASAGLATVFSRSDTMEKQILQIDGMDVCVAGKSYFSQFESHNPLRGFNVPVEGQHNILLIHGSLQGLNVASSVPQMASQNPFGPQDITTGLNYLALGHFHNHYDREHGRCKIVNPGSIEKLSWAEMNDDKGFVWAELKSSEISLEFVKLETRPMERHTLNLSKDRKYLPNFKDYIIGCIRNQGGVNKIVRFDFGGEISQEQYDQLRLAEIFQAVGDEFFHLFLDRTELSVESFGRIFTGKVDSPIEAYAKRLDVLIDQAKDAEKKMHLEQAKELGRKYLEATSR